MSAPRLLPVVLALLLGCASAPERSAPSMRLAYRVEVPGPPSGAQELVLAVRLPAAETLSAREASVLVGNASLALALGPASSAVHRTFADLSWDAPARVLWAASRGRALELVLWLAAEPGAPRAELEHELRLGTSALGDGAPVELRARLLDAP